ncbi:MAG: tRNA 2-thiouridine(34) synthase MnmA [Clostridia bacterium]|nr:tRNA 2-thiouridine(34) synthase MnmA [Clostridia bacterium]
MMKNKKVTVAMSGGIDSAVAALLVLRDGYDTCGATMKLCEKVSDDGIDLAEQDVADARAVCERIGIEHFVYDMSREFHATVINDFIDTYYKGGTPNPCIVCNKHLKFGCLLDEAIKNGSDFVATGHYAQTEIREDGRILLKKATDAQKDQTYMLWSLSQYQLQHTLFPLGQLTKPEIRKIGEENGFVIAHKSDSQDICFVPDGDYASFIEKEKGEKYPAGEYIDEDGNVLGKHKGIIHYTIGQRKGLGISMGRHIFVTKKDAESNTVTLADEDKLFTRTVVIRGINLIPFDRIDGKIRIKAKIRYRHAESDAFAEQTGDDEITLTFDEPQRAPAPGQSAVLYDGDYVVGGGIIQ